jgi:hypothetical protein
MLWSPVWSPAAVDETAAHRQVRTHGTFGHFVEQAQRIGGVGPGDLQLAHRQRDRNAVDEGQRLDPLKRSMLGSPIAIVRAR